MPTNRTHSFNVLLSPTERAQLRTLSAIIKVPAGQILRQALHSLYTMISQGTPLCATGARCMCPHLVQVEYPDARTMPLPNSSPPEGPQAHG